DRTAIGMASHHVGNEAIAEIGEERHRATHVDDQDGAKLLAGIDDRVRPAVVEQHGLAFSPDVILPVNDELRRILRGHAHAEVIAQVAEIGSFVLRDRFARVENREESLDHVRHLFQRPARFRTARPVLRGPVTHDLQHEHVPTPGRGCRNIPLAGIDLVVLRQLVPFTDQLVEFLLNGRVGARDMIERWISFAYGKERGTRFPPNEQAEEGIHRRFYDMIVELHDPIAPDWPRYCPAPARIRVPTVTPNASSVPDLTSARSDVSRLYLSIALGSSAEPRCVICSHAGPIRP